MLHSLTPTDCARAREAASARADGELSELESGALDAHLHGCPACRDFARSAAGLAVPTEAASG